MIKYRSWEINNGNALLVHTLNPSCELDKLVDYSNKLKDYSFSMSFDNLANDDVWTPTTVPVMQVTKGNSWKLNCMGYVKNAIGKPIVLTTQEKLELDKLFTLYKEYYDSFSYVYSLSFIRINKAREFTFPSDEELAERAKVEKAQKATLIDRINKEEE